MSRVTDLRADYELLGRALTEAEGSAVAAIARERRLIGAVLELLESPEVKTRVDELAAKRAGSGVSRPPARRKSG
jgi:hypothetical protein